MVLAAADRPSALGVGSALRPRLAVAAGVRKPPRADAGTGVFSCRPGDGVVGCGVAPGCVCRLSASTSHGPAPVVDAGCSAAGLAWPARTAALAGIAALGPRMVGDAAVATASRAGRDAMRNPSGRRLDDLRRQYLDVAYPASLRAYVGTAVVALPGTRLFLRDRPAVLVPGYATVSQPATSLALDAAALPVFGRPSGYGAVGRCSRLPTTCFTRGMRRRREFGTFRR